MQKNKRLIAKIYNGEEVIMTIDRNMLSCEFGALDRGNLTDVVNWGIYANRGSISFIDNIGYFNNQNVNSSNIKKYIVKFYLAKSQETLISTFKVDTVEFDDETRRVDIQLIGKIIELQRKPSSVYNEVVFTFYEKNANYLLGLEDELTDSEYGTYYTKYPSYGIRLGEDSNRIEKTFIYCPYLPLEKAWDRITKICQATMCRVIENENGEPIITGERPQKTPIFVKPKNIVSISNFDFFRVTNTSIDLTNRTRYENKKVDQASKHIDINYNESGDPISISNSSEHSIGEWEDITDSNGLIISSYRPASFSSRVSIPYKTHHISSAQLVKSLEVYQNSQNYSTESSPQLSFVNLNNYDTLNLSDYFTIQESISNKLTNVKSLDYSFYLNYFEDLANETITKITDENEDDVVRIDSNDLVQTSSYYVDYDGTKKSLGDYILQEVKRRYANGRECFEIECLFNDYYDENGNKVFSKDDLSTHFKKYDVIIPYVMKKGQTVPLRVNEDGTPKKFRVIGISYSYDGLLKQKLSVQEERYDID